MHLLLAMVYKEIAEIITRLSFKGFLNGKARLQLKCHSEKSGDIVMELITRCRDVVHDNMIVLDSDIIFPLYFSGPSLLRCMWQLSSVQPAASHR
jgi:hypothetical protein